MNDEIRSRIEQRHRQLLLHGYLYYQLNESIIPDTTWDLWCKELVELREAYPEEARAAAFFDLCKGIDTCGSGYFIREFPPEIVSVAARVLHKAKGQGVPFEQFIARYGLKVLFDGQEANKQKRGRSK